MSRSFDDLPKFTPLQTQTDQLTKMQKDLAQSAVSATGPMEQLRKKIISLGETAQKLYDEYAGKGTGQQTSLSGIQTQKIEAWEQKEGLKSGGMQTAYMNAAKSLTDSAKGISGMSNDVSDIRSNLTTIARNGTVNIQSVRILG